VSPLRPPRGVLSFKALLHVNLDIPGKSEEGLLDVDAGLGGGLHELDSVLDGQLLSALFRNLSPVVHVALVAEDHLLHVGAGVLLNVPDPVLDIVKGLLVGDVVHQHNAHGSSVVGRGDGPEPLLAGGVPDLELDLLTVQLNRPDFEIYAYGGDEGGIEGILGEPEENARLPDSTVPDEQQLEQVVVCLGHPASRLLFFC